MLIIVVASHLRSSPNRWIHSTYAIQKQNLCDFLLSLLLIRYARSFVWDVFGLMLLFFRCIFYSWFHSVFSSLVSLLLSFNCVLCLVLPRITSIHSVWVHCSINSLCPCVHSLMHSNSEIHVINHKIHWLFQTIDITWYSDTFNSIFRSFNRSFFLVSFLFFHSMPLSVLQQRNWTELNGTKKRSHSFYRNGEQKKWNVEHKEKMIMEECIEHSTTNDHYNFFLFLFISWC